MKGRQSALTMGRKNIFDVLSEDRNCKRELDRINQLFSTQMVYNSYVDTPYTLVQFADRTWFKMWKNRGRFINASDFMKDSGYAILIQKKNPNINDLLTVIEIIYNLSLQTLQCVTGKYSSICNEYEYKIDDDFVRLIEIMQDELSYYNYKFEYDEEKARGIIIEDKPEATAVSEIVDPNLAKPILRYNHFTLKGDLKSKRMILKQMGDCLEPRRRELKSIDSSIEKTIFFMLNNVNIRHNNVTPGDKFYKEKVATMPQQELEEWYDELYQMILLAFLKLDNVERIRKAHILMQEIDGKDTV